MNKEEIISKVNEILALITIIIIVIPIGYLTIYYLGLLVLLIIEVLFDINLEKNRFYPSAFGFLALNFIIYIFKLRRRNLLWEKERRSSP